MNCDIDAFPGWIGGGFLGGGTARVKWRGLTAPSAGAKGPDPIRTPFADVRQQA
jgi:hypothetical protein